MSTFQKGDKVVARIEAQGLKINTVYEVERVVDLPFGCVEYYVKTDGDPRVLGIANRHLLLNKALVVPIPQPVSLMDEFVAEALAKEAARPMTWEEMQKATLKPTDLRRGAAGMWVAEASDLGWPPDFFPPSILAYVNGEWKMLKRSASDEFSTTYTAVLCTVVIYND
jgi:hypothetical protein